MTTTDAPKATRRRKDYQPHLLPPVPPTYRNATVPIGSLPPDDLIRGEPPDNDIVESVRMIGIVDPITVRVNHDWVEDVDAPTDQHYLVDDGGRRIKAARLLAERFAEAGQPVPSYLVDIPARIILDVGDVGGAAIALQKHSTRRRNKVAEYERVKTMAADGADDRTIAAETRLTLSQIKELRSLDTLRADLLESAGRSKISWGQAHDIAKLPAPAQERLAAILAENGVLKASDLVAERSARRETATTAMPWTAITSTPDSTGASAEQSPEHAAEHAFRDTVGHDPADAARLIERLQTDLAEAQRRATGVDAHGVDRRERLDTRLGELERDRRPVLDERAYAIGTAVLAAIGRLADGSYRSEVVLTVDGRDYWIQVQPVTALGRDSEYSATEPTATTSESIAGIRPQPADVLDDGPTAGLGEHMSAAYIDHFAALGASAEPVDRFVDCPHYGRPYSPEQQHAHTIPLDVSFARTRPQRIKPCEHGADAETCDEPACRRRRANRERMRASRSRA